MKRVVSVWLPSLATDRLRRSSDAPPADSPLATASAGTLRRIVALDGAARRGGIRPGQSAADALALMPSLTLVPSDPGAERALLDRLAEWCGHYTPWAAADAWEESGYGLWLDITGCAHLFGGELELMARLAARLKRMGFAARAAAADTPGAAWAWARYGDPASPCLGGGHQRNALAPLPVAALRLAARTAMTLTGLGLRRVGDLYGLPRASLAVRFGRELSHRLDQALGAEDEPISPRQAPPVHAVHAAFVEPVGRPEDVVEAVRRLLARLCAQLASDRLGVRRLGVTGFCVDGAVRSIAVGTSRASHDPVHLMRLLAEQLPMLDPGLGMESLKVAALETDPQAPEQIALEAKGERADDLARLLDSLSNRLGFERVARLLPQESHLPERAVRRAAPGTMPDTIPRWPDKRRPVRLLAPPEPVEATAPVPDAPPLMFCWRNRTRRIVRAEGAERIAAEWWRKDAPPRDYYLVEDMAGERFWLFREGLYGGPVPPRWYLHGIFP